MNKKIFKNLFSLGLSCGLVFAFWGLEKAMLPKGGYNELLHSLAQPKDILGMIIKSLIGDTINSYEKSLFWVMFSRYLSIAICVFFALNLASNIIGLNWPEYTRKDLCITYCF